MVVRRGKTFLFISQINKVGWRDDEAETFKILQERFLSRGGTFRKIGFSITVMQPSSGILSH